MNIRIGLGKKEDSDCFLVCVMGLDAKEHKELRRMSCSEPVKKQPIHAFNIKHLQHSMTDSRTEYKTYNTKLKILSMIL